MTAGDRQWPDGRNPKDPRPSARDHLSDVPVRARLAANRVHVAASNATWRVAKRLHVDRPRYRYHDWLNGRAVKRGKDPLPERIGRRVPVWRDRPSPYTGRPRREHRSPGRQLAARSAPRIRAAGNQRHVREQVKQRDPVLDRAVDTLLREPRQQRRAGRGSR